MGVTPGETVDARNVGVFPGENGLAWKDSCSPDEYYYWIIIVYLA